MDDKTLTQHLQHIAEKEIPDDMDHLESIRTQLLYYNRKPSPLRWVAAVAMIMIIFSGVAVYAWVQSADLDPGLTAVDEAGMITEIDLSQTVDDLTVTLEQGYADANRVALWFAIEGLDPEENIMVDIQLLEPTTREMFTMGGGGGSNEFTPQEDGSVILHGQTNISHNHAIDDSGVFELLVKFDLRQYPSAEGSWSGPLPSLGTFEFTVTLPVSEPLAITVEETVSANGIDMILKSLRIAPSATTLELCFDMPDAQDWQPDMTLTVGGIEGSVSSMGTVMPFDMASLYRCMDAEFLVPYLGEEDVTLTLNIPALKTSTSEATPEVLQAATARLAEQGIEVQFNVEGHGMGWEILSAPDDLTESEIGMMIWDSMREFYDGPWSFTITLP